MAGKPLMNPWRLVGGVVVQNGVNLLVRELRCRVVGEGDELVLAVFLVVLSDHPAVQDVERSKQARGAVALVLDYHRTAAIRTRQNDLRSTDMLQLRFAIVNDGFQTTTIIFVTLDFPSSGLAKTPPPFI